MVIQNDGTGNFFLGDAVYGNSNPSFSGINFLTGFDHSALNAEITVLLSAAGLGNRFVMSQADLDAYTAFRGLVVFAPSGDTAANDNDRYAFGIGGFTTGGSTINFTNASLYNDLGIVNTANGGNYRTNDVARVVGNGTTSGGSLVGQLFDPPSATISNIQWLGTATSTSLALFAYQMNFSTGQPVSAFWYAGEMVNVTTAFNYYDANVQTKSLVIFGTNNNSFGGANTDNTLKIGHIAGVANFKRALETGDADYAIVCADAQTPVSPFSSTMAVFDDDASLSNPTMGDLQNIVITQGNFTLGKTTKITGASIPAGQNSWIPVGRWGASSKWMLMRAYTTT